MNTTTQRNAADTAILRELAAKTVSDSAFALNTNDLPGTAKCLRHALSCIERLMQATPVTQPNGFTGYSINATNGHHSGDEFEGYDLNNPSGEKQAPVIGNARLADDGFDNYSMNNVNEGGLSHG